MFLGLRDILFSFGYIVCNVLNYLTAFTHSILMFTLSMSLMRYVIKV
jgi:hypothetical protein